MLPVGGEWKVQRVITRKKDLRMAAGRTGDPQGSQRRANSLIEPLDTGNESLIDAGKGLADCLSGDITHEIFDRAGSGQAVAEVTVGKHVDNNDPLQMSPDLARQETAAQRQRTV